MHQLAKRDRKSRFVEIDGHTVLKLNNYSLEDGEGSVFQTELVKKEEDEQADAPGSNTGKRKSVRGSSRRMGGQGGRQQAGRDYAHEGHCLSCWDGGTLVCCDMCPAAFHPSACSCPLSY